MSKRGFATLGFIISLVIVAIVKAMGFNVTLLLCLIGFVFIPMMLKKDKKVRAKGLKNKGGL